MRALPLKLIESDGVDLSSWMKEQNDRYYAAKREAKERGEYMATIRAELSDELFDQLMAGSRRRGEYKSFLLNEFIPLLEKAQKAGKDRFGIQVDPEGKSTATVRNGLNDAIKNLGLENVRVTVSDEVIGLLWTK